MPNILFGAAAEFAAAKYGGGMGETEDVLSVGTTQSRILSNDPERVFVLLVNLSANTIYVGFDEAVGSTRGIILGASGGSYQTDTESDLVLPARAMFALAGGAASNLYALTLRRITKEVINATG